MRSFFSIHISTNLPVSSSVKVTRMWVVPDESVYRKPSLSSGKTIPTVSFLMVNRDSGGEDNLHKGIVSGLPGQPTAVVSGAIVTIESDPISASGVLVGEGVVPVTILAEQPLIGMTDRQSPMATRIAVLILSGW